MHPKPSAPPLEKFMDEDVHYNCERGCDVEFLVGNNDEDQMRIPVHSSKLLEYPVFKAMLSHNVFLKMDSGGGYLRRYRVNDVDGKAFDNMMKFIYNEQISLSSHDVAVETLKAAQYFLIPELVRECVKHLYKMISISNVLYIFAHVRALCNDMEDLEEITKPTKHWPFPKRRKVSAESAQDDISACLEMKNLCVWLLRQTLMFIDIHGSRVLKRDEFEELDKEHVKFLLKRDSLDCSESDAFSALIRWAETKCKRKHLELFQNCKRDVLHDLLYAVRYFQMTKKEFVSGPAASGILSPVEIELIKNVITYGQAFPQSKRRLSTSSACCPTAKKMQQELRYSLDETNSQSEDLTSFWSHFSYMSRPRIPIVTDGPGEKARRKSTDNFQFRGKSKTLIKFKSVGVVMKNFCLPCTSNTGSKYKEVGVTHEGSKKLNGKKKESKASKIIYFCCQAFAFFFD